MRYDVCAFLNMITRFDFISAFAFRIFFVFTNDFLIYNIHMTFFYADYNNDFKNLRSLFTY